MRRALLLLVLFASPAVADKAPHREGDYGGVVPGQTTKPDLAAKPKHKRPPAKGTLTWIGFDASGGGAQVFLQSVAPFEVSQRLDGTTLVVHLSLRRLGHNTWRQVDTRFFDNPLAGITAKVVRATRATKAHPAEAAGIDVRIAFKNPKEAKEAAVRSATEADGMAYAYLSFPEGADQKPPAATNDPEP